MKSLMRMKMTTRMSSGYYLATNIKTAVAEVIYVDGDTVRSMSAGTLMLVSKLEEWRDFEGPITYGTIRNKS